MKQPSATRTYFGCVTTAMNTQNPAEQKLFEKAVSDVYEALQLMQGAGVEEALFPIVGEDALRLLKQQDNKIEKINENIDSFMAAYQDAVTCGDYTLAAKKLAQEARPLGKTLLEDLTGVLITSNTTANNLATVVAAGADMLDNYKTVLIPEAEAKDATGAQSLTLIHKGEILFSRLQHLDTAYTENLNACARVSKMIGLILQQNEKIESLMNDFDSLGEFSAILSRKDQGNKPKM